MVFELETYKSFYNIHTFFVGMVPIQLTIKCDISTFICDVSTIQYDISTI